VRGPSAFPRLQLHYWSNVLDIPRGRVGADVVVTGFQGAFLFPFSLLQLVDQAKWRDSRAREIIVEATGSSAQGQKRVAVTAALDWVVNQVSSPHAPNLGAGDDPAKVKSRRRAKARNEGV
jgi:hypothetical protein